MSTRTYEAAVKLSTGEVVVYHNINTGLFKFHRFLVEKFSENQRWLYYKVRRKKTKEIIGTFRNSKGEKVIEWVRIYLKPIANNKNTGFFIPIPYERNGYQIIRNIFVANNLIIELTENFITIPEWLYHKVLENGQEELYQYYLSKNHQLEKLDIKVGKIVVDFGRKIIVAEEGTAPNIDYP